MEQMATDPLAVVVSNDVAVADGEYHQLIQSLEDDDVAAPVAISSDVVLQSKTNYDSAASWYGKPLSINEARELMPDDNIYSSYSSNMNSSSTGGTNNFSGNRGLLWNITIIPDEILNSAATSNGTSSFIKRNHHGLNHRDFTLSKLAPVPSSEQASELTVNTVQIKPRRASLPLSVSDFLSSLTILEYDAAATKSIQQGPRCIFHGTLNGWPGLRTLELISIEYRRDASNVIPSPRELLSGQLLWVKLWSINDTPANTGSNPNKTINGVDTHKTSYRKSQSGPNVSSIATTSNTPFLLLKPNRVHRATLRGPSWSAIGWSSDSPGFCFWYETQRPAPLVPTSKVSYGTRMIQELSHRDSLCTNIHMISHRYAVSRIETPRDRLTYHSICLLEWDHGQYCTLVETAYLNGMGGYRCRSNWYDDKDAEPMNRLYSDFPSEMICPWRMTKSEIRCYDVPAKNLNEFRIYMALYSESAPAAQRRFIDVHYTFSHPARLTFRSKVHIAQYLLNYILRDSSYGDLNRNCQTFAADFCSFVAGKKGVAPFHPVNRIEYQNRTHMFLYDSHLYEKKRNTKK